MIRSSHSKTSNDGEEERENKKLAKERQKEKMLYGPFGPVIWAKRSFTLVPPKMKVGKIKKKVNVNLILQPYRFL